MFRKHGERVAMQGRATINISWFDSSHLRQIKLIFVCSCNLLKTWASKTRNTESPRKCFRDKLTSIVEPPLKFNCQNLSLKLSGRWESPTFHACRHSVKPNIFLAD